MSCTHICDLSRPGYIKLEENYLVIYRKQKYFLFKRLIGSQNEQKKNNDNHNKTMTKGPDNYPNIISLTTIKRILTKRMGTCYQKSEK